MPLDNENMDRRRQRREEAKKKQRAQQRRLVSLLVVAGLVLMGCGIVIYRIASKTPESQPVSAVATTEATEAASESTEPTSVRQARNPITKIHIRAVGDLNITNSVVDSGIVATGYDYTRAFQDVAAELGVADVTVMNIEGNFCGEPYGSQTASAPQELLTYLKSAGVDLIQMANSYSVQNGIIGLSASLNAIRSAGMEPLGAYATAADFHKTKGYTICEVQGIKVAFVAFTKGVGGMGMPAGSEECVNLLYEDYNSNYTKIDRKRITAILKDVKAEKPDITVAMLHWGSVNNDEISKTQESIVSLMQKNGVDVIIGTHPHLVQKIDLDQKTGKLVAYSLGDFYGDATLGGSNYSIILDIEVTKDEDLKTTKVTNFSYIPIYTLKESEGDGYRRVVRINEAMAAYEGNYVDKISSTAYSQMEYSLTRIEARVHGKTADDTSKTTKK